MNDFINSLLGSNPYQILKEEKNRIFKTYFEKLNHHHYNNCKEFKIILDNFKFSKKKYKNLEQYPMLPISIFKDYDLISSKKEKIVKKVLSSGTSGNSLSKINLDKTNALNQMKVLTKLLETFIGSERLPMIIVDQDPRKNSIIKFNARAAAIHGFSLLGKNYCYILDEKDKLLFEKFNNFVKTFGSQKFLIFGFTSFIYNALLANDLRKKKRIDLRNGILIHGGGWKKLEKNKINNDLFKKKLFEKYNLKSIFNYYGLVEQTGSIFIEGFNCNYLHSSIFSDIFIRDKNFNILNKGQKGMIQLLSLLPSSYPGHNILTEDIGEIIGEDDCECGLKGKYFKVYGRLKEAELRGCSDVT